MQQLFNLWSTLDLRRRIIVGLATLAVFAAVLVMSRMAARPNLTLLYAGLESGPAGEVVSALEQRGVTYEVRGSSIFVPGGQRDELRLTLAGEGLPPNGSKGYELLDSLSGFGTTSQMFDAAYWRAKEGELARTIVSNPLISMARVHIAHDGSNPFQRDTRPTASVLITTSGGALSTAQAKAVRYLTAAAVAGMVPEDVSVIDSEAGLIGTTDEAPQRAGTELVAELRERVQRLLEARVGRGNAVVEVSVATVTETETIREHRFDPESRVAISTDSEERSNTARDQGGGDVTVASNIPEGDAEGQDSSTSQSSETRERVNYEVSSTERELLRAPGAVKRLTVAVLVNGVGNPAEASGALVPRSDEELAALRDLVASAVGYDEARGDVITLKSMVFQPVIPLGSAAATGLWAGLEFDVMSLIQLAVLALVTLILGLFVLRPLLMRPAAGDAGRLPSPQEYEDSVEQGAGKDDLETLIGEIDDGTDDLDDLPLVSGQGARPGEEGADARAPVERLRAMIGERQEETTEILRSWLEEREESA